MFHVHCKAQGASRVGEKFACSAVVQLHVAKAKQQTTRITQGYEARRSKSKEGAEVYVFV